MLMSVSSIKGVKKKEVFSLCLRVLVKGREGGKSISNLSSLFLVMPFSLPTFFFAIILLMCSECQHSNYIDCAEVSITSAGVVRPKYPAKEEDLSKHWIKEFCLSTSSSVIQEERESLAPPHVLHFQIYLPLKNLDMLDRYSADLAASSSPSSNMIEREEKWEKKTVSQQQREFDIEVDYEEEETTTPTKNVEKMLKSWRRILAPKKDHFELAEQWLLENITYPQQRRAPKITLRKNLQHTAIYGEHQISKTRNQPSDGTLAKSSAAVCSFSWDTISCENIPHGAVVRLFHHPLFFKDGKVPAARPSICAFRMIHNGNFQVEKGRGREGENNEKGGHHHLYYFFDETTPPHHHTTTTTTAPQNTTEEHNMLNKEKSLRLVLPPFVESLHGIRFFNPTVKGKHKSRKVVHPSSKKMEKLREKTTDSKAAKTEENFSENEKKKKSEEGNLPKRQTSFWPYNYTNSSTGVNRSTSNVMPLRNAPWILEAWLSENSIWSVDVALFCIDGKPAKARKQDLDQNQTTSAQYWCNNGNNFFLSPPVKLKFNLSPAWSDSSSSTVAENIFFVNISSQNCFAAGFHRTRSNGSSVRALFHNKTDALYTHIVCHIRFDTWYDDLGITLPLLQQWQEYKLEASTGYQESPSSPMTYSEQGYFFNYFDANFFPCSSNCSSSGRNCFSSCFSPTSQQRQLNISLVTLINPTHVRPKDIRALYNVPESEIVFSPPANQAPRITPAQKANLPYQGVIEFTDTTDLGTGFNISDLALFMRDQEVVPFTPSSSYSDSWSDAMSYLQELVIPVFDMGTVDKDETSLDMELIMSVAPGSPTVLWNIISGPNETYTDYVSSFLGWAQNITSITTSTSSTSSRKNNSEIPEYARPLVWSISYGGPEWGKDSDRLSVYFQMMSVSGISIVASSGDEGSGFENEWAPIASWPSSSPFVVSVGATALRIPQGESTAAGIINQPNYPRINGTQEIVCSAATNNVITTGGAFSSQFQLPSYQAQNIQDYVGNLSLMRDDALHPDPDQDMALALLKTRRGIPDVSTIGAHIRTVIEQHNSTLFGTSASAPILGGLLTLLHRQRQIFNSKNNDGRLAAGLPLVNYFLYAAARNSSTTSDKLQPYRDVVDGNTCAGEIGELGGNFPTYRRGRCYPATPGWDAATGLGTPNYLFLKQFALTWVAPKLPQPSPTETPNSKFSPGVKVFLTILGACLVLIPVSMCLYQWITHTRRHERPHRLGTAYQFRFHQDEEDAEEASRRYEEQQFRRQTSSPLLSSGKKKSAVSKPSGPLSEQELSLLDEAL